MNVLKTFYYRVLLPYGQVRHGLLRLAVERDHSARLRLERETEGTDASLSAPASVQSDR